LLSSRDGPFEWQFYAEAGENLAIYYAQGRFAPKYTHRVSLRRAKRQCDTALCNLQYRCVEDIPGTAEKLRWLRCQRNLFQVEVADYAGLERSTYIGYEEGARDSYPPDKLAKIAELFGVSAEDLLDEYNRFLARQGAEVRAIRRECGLSQEQFAATLGASEGAVRRWESGKARMTKGMWERIMVLRKRSGTDLGKFQKILSE
jgi:transcriptional regulator with XRE-family HTH domain